MHALHRSSFRNLSLFAALLPPVLGLAAIPAAADTLVSATASSSATMTFNSSLGIQLESPSSLDAAVGSQVTAVSGSGGGAPLYTWATVTQNLGSARSIVMDWRVRTLNESFKAEPGGNPTQPPLDMDGLYFGLAGDVLELTGFAPGEKYVLQMSYQTNPAWFDEAEEIRTNSIHVAWLNPVTGIWEDASKANSQNATDRLVNYAGSWAAAGKPMTLGSWGVDADSQVAWMVLDHNSSFVVTPEPSSVALAAIGSAGAAWMFGRRQRTGSGNRTDRRIRRHGGMLGIFLSTFLMQLTLYSAVGSALAG